MRVMVSGLLGTTHKSGLSGHSSCSFQTSIIFLETETPQADHVREMAKRCPRLLTRYSCRGREGEAMAGWPSDCLIQTRALRRLNGGSKHDSELRIDTMERVMSEAKWTNPTVLPIQY